MMYTREYTDNVKRAGYSFQWMKIKSVEEHGNETPLCFLLLKTSQ